MNLNRDINIIEKILCYCNQIDEAHTEYILNLRIEQAKKLLKTSSLPITDVALMSGFNNSNYFSTAFKKEVGKSPVEYRLKKQPTTQQ